MINILKNEPLRKFLLWALTGIVICLVGITNVNAATYYMNSSFEQQYYDNRGSSVIAVTTSWNDSFNSYISSDIKTAAGSYGAGLSFSSPIPLLSNHTYSMSVYFVETNNITLSSKNIISVASSLSAAANDYANNNPGTTLLYSAVSDNKILQFVFKVDNNHTHIFFPWTTTTTTTQDYVLTEIIMEDLGSEGVSQEDINNSLTNQTNELNQSIQNSTNDINQNINDMEQSIIDSNKETQDVIKDQFNSCRDSVNLINFNNVVKSNSNVEYEVLETGIRVYNTTAGTYRNVYIDTDVLDAGTYTLNKDINVSSGFAYILVQNLDGTTQNIINSSKSGPITFNLETNGIIRIVLYSTRSTSEVGDVSYTNLQLQKGSVFTEYEEYGKEVCSNKIDETNDKLDNLQGSITDETPPDVSSFGDVAGWLPPGPLDSILNLPLTLLNNLNTNLGKSCSPLTVNIPYVDKTIQIPCISTIFNQITGVTSFWNWVGTISAAFILFNYLIALYNWVDRVLSLRLETYEAFGGVSKDFGSV